MVEKLFEDQEFRGTNFAGQKLVQTEYNNCSFFNCDFSDTDLSHSNFIDCSFTGCNFAMAKLFSTGLKTVIFEHCKLIGINFDACSDFLFAVEFKNCVLDYSSFAKKKIKKTRFEDSSLKEVDFSETDLTEAQFRNCNLSRALFNKSVLEMTDFRTALNYSIDPENNRIKKARFSYPGMIGLLDKYQIDIE